MSEEKSLMSVLQPFSEMFVEILKAYNKSLTEITNSLKILPREELTKEKIDEFLEALIKEVLKNLPDEGPIADIQLFIPDMIRTNFYAGVNAARELERLK